MSPLTLLRSFAFAPALSVTSPFTELTFCASESALTETLRLTLLLLLALAFCIKPGFASSATKAAVMIVDSALGIIRFEEQKFIALPYVRQRRLGKPLPSHVQKAELWFEDQKLPFQLSVGQTC